MSTGSRNAILNSEARTVEADVLSRRCVMMRLADFSYEKYQKALRQSAGAVVIILPQNMSTMPQDIVQVRPRYTVSVSQNSTLRRLNVGRIFCSSSWSWSRSCWPRRRPCRCISPSRTRSCCLFTIRRRSRPPRRGLRQRRKVRDAKTSLFSVYTYCVKTETLVFSVLLHTATANGFQMVTSGAQSKAVSDWAITSLEVSETDCRICAVSS